jgi:hypothetical protein
MLRHGLNVPNVSTLEQSIIEEQLSLPLELEWSILNSSSSRWAINYRDGMVYGCRRSMTRIKENGCFFQCEKWWWHHLVKFAPQSDMLYMYPLGRIIHRFYSLNNIHAYFKLSHSHKMCHNLYFGWILWFFSYFSRLFHW